MVLEQERSFVVSEVRQIVVGPRRGGLRGLIGDSWGSCMVGGPWMSLPGPGDRGNDNIGDWRGITRHILQRERESVPEANLVITQRAFLIVIASQTSRGKNQDEKTWSIGRKL